MREAPCPVWESHATPVCRTRCTCPRARGGSLRAMSEMARASSERARDCSWMNTPQGIVGPTHTRRHGPRLPWMQRLWDRLLVASIILEICETGYCATCESANPDAKEVRRVQTLDGHVVADHWVFVPAAPRPSPSTRKPPSGERSSSHFARHPTAARAPRRRAALAGAPRAVRPAPPAVAAGRAATRPSASPVGSRVPVREG